MGTIDLRGKAGPCAHLLRYSGAIIQANVEQEFYIPYWDFPSISTRQELRQPIKELYQESFEVLSSGESTLSAIAGAATTILDIFGVQIASKNFYAQSWKGGVPTAFTLNLNFFRGITGSRWDALNDVYNPIMVLIGKTIPSGDAALMTAPVPSSANAFVAFTTDFVTAAIKGVINALPNSIVGNITNPPAAKTWTMEFGWQDAGKTFTPFFRLLDTIVESSTFKFSSMMEVSAGKAFPISGTVTLSCKTQSILTTSDLNNQPVVPNGG
jgi:hypothetical protein